MSEQPEDVLRVLDKIAREFNLDSTNATPLMRTFLVLQSKPGVFFDEASARVFRNAPRALEELRSNPKFERYHRGSGTAPAGEEPSSSSSSSSSNSRNSRSTRGSTSNRIRKSNRSMAGNDREHGSSLWHAMFHFAQLPKDFDPVHSGASVHKKLKTLAFFDRDITQDFQQEVSRKAIVPLFCMAHLEQRNLATILSGWSDENVSRAKSDEIAAWVKDWKPLGGDAAHARDLGELIANLDWPEETTRLARSREQARIAMRNAPAPLRNGHVAFENMEKHGVHTSNYVRAPDDIDAMTRMRKALRLRDSIPSNRVKLLFLITQIPSPEANYDVFFDGDDESTIARLHEHVGSDGRYVSPDEWKKFMAQTLMREGKQTCVNAGAKHIDDLLSKNASIAQHEALAKAIQPVSADVARMNSIDKMARLVTAYSHEWQEKWYGLFGGLSEDIEKAVEDFKAHQPIIDQPELEAIAEAAFC